MPATTSLPVPESAREGLPATAGPVVVATDGTTSADAAVRAAAQFVARTQAPVVVLSVLPPAPIVAADYGILLPPMETEQARRDALEGRVRAQLREIVGPATNWTVDLRSGDPSTRIAAAAREYKAQMVFLGLGHHDLLDRLFGGETALHVLRVASVPVLAVPQNFQHMPARLAIATDFSPASLDAARAALTILRPWLNVVYIAHVAPRLELQPEAYASWMTQYGAGVEPAFTRFTAELELPAHVTVETITLTGKPSRALLDFVKAAHLDAVITGSRGAGFIDRLLVGSTATALIRGAHCSVFAVPHRIAPDGSNGGGASVPEEEWASQLSQFTRRNAGRSARLEVDDPEYGAQSQHQGYPFQGAAWDHHDRRVEIMMGEPDSTQHFTRGVSDVKSVDILKDASGRDTVLRIAHGSGQTILTLVR